MQNEMIIIQAVSTILLFTFIHTIKAVKIVAADHGGVRSFVNPLAKQSLFISKTGWQTSL